ncbi:MAG: carboxymuconolactone decarboxylase family protein [Thermodesulfobacteriota bacterium]
MSEYMFKSNIRDEIGLLKKIKPELHEGWQTFHDAVFADGALSKKEKELIAVAGSHITRCPYCIRGRVKTSKHAGASDEEIVEAIYVGMRFAMGAPFAYSNIAFETYDALENDEPTTEGHFFKKNITKEIGEFRKASGPISKPFMDFHSKVFQDGALSKTMKRAIIGLACAHMTRCPWCIRGCAKDAVDFGVSREQVAEAINVAMVMAAGACYAHTGISMETLKDVNSGGAKSAGSASSGSSDKMEDAVQQNLKEDTSDIECGC